MKVQFINTPQATNMVTEPCDKANCIDLLCVDCGWSGHCEPKDAAWPTFKNHKCRLRTQSISTSD